LPVGEDSRVVSIDKFGDEFVDTAVAKDGLGCFVSVMYHIDLHPLHFISWKLYHQLLCLGFNFDDGLLLLCWLNFDADLNRRIFYHLLVKGNKFITASS
jgi:hypothetical protein